MSELRAPFPSGSVLLIGYGNIARQDDGIGPLLVERLGELALPGLVLESDYQLNIEDAATLARYDAVVFADADATGSEPFSFTELGAEADGSFTTHKVSPAGVLYLAQTHFAARTKGYVLAIRGYEFTMFVEALTAGAQANLDAACAFVADGAQASHTREPEPTSK
jgi:hydrogenase maturation protease